MAEDRISLEVAVKGDRRAQLESIRDYVAHQLEGELCNNCLMSRLRTGDQASLILRLQTVLAELDALPSGEAEQSKLGSIRSLRAVEDIGAPPVSGKSAMRRTGSRKAGGGRHPEGEVGS